MGWFKCLISLKFTFLIKDFFRQTFGSVGMNVSGLSYVLVDKYIVGSKLIEKKIAIHVSYLKPL